MINAMNVRKEKNYKCHECAEGKGDMDQECAKGKEL